MISYNILVISRCNIFLLDLIFFLLNSRVNFLLVMMYFLAKVNPKKMTTIKYFFLYIIYLYK